MPFRYRFPPQCPLSLASITAVITLLAGCSSESATVPKTYAVRGTIIDHQGKPITAGAIQFKSIDNPALTAVVEIKPDGSFEMQTMFENKKLPGALPGNHTVTFLPRMSAAQTELPVVLPAPVIVESKDDNSVTIRIPKPN